MENIEKCNQNVSLSFTAADIYQSTKMDTENVRVPINRTNSLSFSVYILFYFACYVLCVLLQYACSILITIVQHVEHLFPVNFSSGVKNYGESV